MRRAPTGRWPGDGVWIPCRLVQSPAKSSSFRQRVEEWAVWAARVLWLVVAVGRRRRFRRGARRAQPRRAAHRHDDAVDRVGDRGDHARDPVGARAHDRADDRADRCGRRVASRCSTPGPRRRRSSRSRPRSAARARDRQRRVRQSMVQASAYGDEQRFVLRPPAAFYAPTVASWVVLVRRAPSIGPLALAARNWIVGAPVSGRSDRARCVPAPPLPSARRADGWCSCRPASCCTTTSCSPRR